MIKFVKIEMSRTKLSFSSKIRYQKYQGSFSSQNKKQQIFSLTRKVIKWRRKMNAELRTSVMKRAQDRE